MRSKPPNRGETGSRTANHGPFLICSTTLSERPSKGLVIIGSPGPIGCSIPPVLLAVVHETAPDQRSAKGLQGWPAYWLGPAPIRAQGGSRGLPDQEAA